MKKQSTTFGIIALVISCFLFFTPRLLLSIGLMAWAIFFIISLVRESNKILPIVSLFLAMGILYLLVKEEVNAQSDYQVLYTVECTECDITYTNDSGGTDQLDDFTGGTFNKVVTVKGNSFLTLSAQLGGDGGTATVKASVNDAVIKTETSTGAYKMASIMFRPDDIFTTNP